MAPTQSAHRLLALFLLTWGLFGILASWPLNFCRGAGADIELSRLTPLVVLAYLATRILYAAAGLAIAKGSRYGGELAIVAATASLTLLSSLPFLEAIAYGVAVEAAVALLTVAAVTRA